MDEFWERVITQFDSYKRKNKNDLLKWIPVYAHSELQAFLRPITFDYAHTVPLCAGLLCKWRLANPTLARSQVPITEQSTDRWMEQTILNVPDRILFLIYEADLSNILGHVGLREVEPERRLMHLDLVLRGVQGVSPGLMENSIRALTAWGKQELGLKNLAVETFFDNERAIRLYERCGFEMVSRRPLIREPLESGFRWIFADEPTAVRAERYECTMERIL